jgi:hypothetical protein
LICYLLSKSTINDVRNCDLYPKMLSNIFAEKYGFIYYLIQITGNFFNILKKLLLKSSVC